MSGPRRKAGRIGPHIAGFEAPLISLSYTSGTVRNSLKVAGQLGRWLVSANVEVSDLNSVVIDAFRAARLADGFRRLPVSPPANPQPTPTAQDHADESKAWIRYPQTSSSDNAQYHRVQPRGAELAPVAARRTLLLPSASKPRWRRPSAAHDRLVLVRAL